MLNYAKMTDIIPQSIKGIARVEHVQITQEAVEYMRLRFFITGGREVPTPAGDYCQLFVGSTLMMSDTRMEKNTNAGVVLEARGHVFIAGLGLGMILVPILAKPDVTRVTVVEKHQDVIDLIAPHFQDPRLEIIHSDIFEFKPEKGSKFDVIYFDIWPSMSADNLPEMRRLEARFRKFKSQDGWMDCWAKHQCRRLK